MVRITSFGAAGSMVAVPYGFGDAAVLAEIGSESDIKIVVTTTLERVRFTNSPHNDSVNGPR
jgi:hypothetical protein